MVFPSDLDDDPQEDREEDLEDRAEWLDEVEDEYIDEGDLTASDTIDGHDPASDLDDEDPFENAYDEAMHEEDLD